MTVLAMPTARAGHEPSPTVSAVPVTIPIAVRELVLSLGEAEWGQTPAHDAEGHGAHVADSVRMTAEHFGQSEDQHMHGLYLKGTETVMCHTGTSPNSPRIAQALTGAWNWLLGECAAQGMAARSDETGTGSAVGNSPVGVAEAPTPSPKASTQTPPAKHQEQGN